MNAEAFPCLRSLGNLAGVRPVVVIDTREAIERGEYISRIAPKAVLATLAALEARFDVPIVFCPSSEEAGRRIESWAFWFARELVQNVNGLARAAGVT